jgi:hypothetical protein
VTWFALPLQRQPALRLLRTLLQPYLPGLSFQPAQWLSCLCRHVLLAILKSSSIVNVATVAPDSRPTSDDDLPTMRLLVYQDDKINLTDDLKEDLPKYAILSHTWGRDDEEVNYCDIKHGTGEDKIGYKKIRFCAEQAKRDGLEHCWVDTCCIDQSNPIEVQRSINSMFRWYRDATRCYVYLQDIAVVGSERGDEQSDAVWDPAFRAHRWFTRGWTLQELLAPVSVEFFTDKGQRLGDKLSLALQIRETTGIPTEALQDNRLDRFGIDERFTWARNRETKYEEDWAYCLLGIFGVFMPLIYGEGKMHAVRRLKKEIADAMHHDDATFQPEGDHLILSYSSD